MNAVRLPNNPLVALDADPSIGDNINGPSLIRVPEWAAHPLGRYYLYFAHHAGKYIRMAYADAVEGPWHIHGPGTLQLRDSGFRWAHHGHIASPDVHVEEARKQIVMFYHGGYVLRQPKHAMPVRTQEGSSVGFWMNWKVNHQVTRVAVSEDGLHFRKLPGWLGAPYWRRFAWNGRYYAIAMPGLFYESDDGLTNFRPLPVELFTSFMRHAAVLVEGDQLRVFYTNVGDAPEQILCSIISLHADPGRWQIVDTQKVLEPATDYEGVDLPLEPSRRGLILGRARRDPCIFVDQDRRYLLYSAAGEYAIAGATLDA